MRDGLKRVPFRVGSGWYQISGHLWHDATPLPHGTHTTQQQWQPCHTATRHTHDAAAVAAAPLPHCHTAHTRRSSNGSCTPATLPHGTHHTTQRSSSGSTAPLAAWKATVIATTGFRFHSATTTIDHQSSGMEFVAMIIIARVLELINTDVLLMTVRN
jgi:hypothetical protein